MAEKIRPPHLPTASAPSQQPLLPPSGHADGVQHGAMSKGQPMAVLHSHSPSQPDVAVHPRSASSSVTGTPTQPLFDTRITKTDDKVPEEFSFCTQVQQLCSPNDFNDIINREKLQAKKIVQTLVTMFGIRPLT